MKIKKRFVFVFLSLIFGIAVFIFALQKVGWQEVWRSFNILSWWQFLLVLLIALISFLFSSLAWRIILRTHRKKDFSLIKVLRAKLVGFSLDYLTPSAYVGGEPVRAILIKEEENIDFKEGIASVIVNKILELTIDLVFIIVGIVYLFIYFSLPQWLNLILISLLILILASSFFFYSRTFKKKGFLSALINLFGFDKSKKMQGVASNIQEVEDLISDFFVHHPKDLIKTSIYSFVSRSLFILCFWLIIFFLNARVNLFQLLGFFALTAVVYFIPIPGALGIHEASQAIIFGLFKLGSRTGIAFSLIWRAVSLIIVTIGLVVLIHFQVKLWRKKINGTLGKIGRWFLSSF